METLPVEIHDAIFQLACTDGGRTGCSLSLVSRRIAAHSQPWRYQSIALVGSRSLLSFSHLATTTQRLAIRALYVSDRSAWDHQLLHLPFAPADPIWYHSRYWNDTDDRQHHHHHHHHDNNNNDKTGANTSWWESWVPTSIAQIVHGPSVRRAHITGVNAALADILTACAPSLRSLTMRLHTPPLFVLVPVHLPVLAHLSFSVSENLVAARDALGLSDVPLPRPLPSLRHLNLLSFPLGGWSKGAFEKLLGTAPNLSRLRLGLRHTMVPLLSTHIPTTLPDTLKRIELHYLDSENSTAHIRRFRGNRLQVYLVRQGAWLAEQHEHYYHNPEGGLHSWISAGLD